MAGVQEWRPASAFEQRLGEAFLADDMLTCLVLLRGAEYALPITAAAAAGDEPPAWTTVRDGELTWLLAYTSVEAMQAATQDRFRHCRVSTLVELAAGWPDQRWGLAVNAGLSVHLELESGTVARLAVPGLAENKVAYPDALPPVMQKLLTPRDIADYLTGPKLRVSGYVHQLLDVAHIATPSVLVEALGESDRQHELITNEGSVNMLRWTAIGSQLYRTPYGGTDEETMAAVSGWVIEEPPFVGLGLARNVDQVIREYKVDGVALPYGTEIWELGADGQEHRRAILDADQGMWLLVASMPPDGDDGADGDGGQVDDQADDQAHDNGPRPGPS